MSNKTLIPKITKNVLSIHTQGTVNDASDIMYAVSPVTGTVIYCAIVVTSGTSNAEEDFTLYNASAVAMTGGVATLANASATLDSTNCSPTANNSVTAGDFIYITPEGANIANIQIKVSILIEYD